MSYDLIEGRNYSSLKSRRPILSISRILVIPRENGNMKETSIPLDRPKLCFRCSELVAKKEVNKNISLPEKLSGTEL